ncbi:MAG: PilT/PilU family type 4a pilus ATPase [Burkholderiales bacterium]
MSAMQKLFELMAQKKASDIFLSTGAPISIKINGNTIPINSQILKPTTIRALIEEILTDEQVAEFDSSRELNFAHSLSGIGSFRLSLFMQRGTPAAVIRFIPSDIPQFDTLGLPPVLKDVILEKRGLILIVGATGSGKSTTLAAMIDHRNAAASGHIITVEDPIEFLFKHKRSIVNQRELGTDFKAYHVALKNVLRQAPDVIFIGEIRDRETMGMAIAYAQTGHLCLSTLHANNSYHALNRIISFYPLDLRTALLQDLSSSLKCICSQRLIKSVDGGRAPAVEVLLNTRHITELIEEGKINEVREAIEKSLSPGSQTFEFALYRLFREGRITQEEALQSADSPTNLLWLINNSVSDEEQAANKSKGSEKSAGGVSSKLMKSQEASFKDFEISMKE